MRCHSPLIVEQPAPTPNEWGLLFWSDQSDQEDGTEERVNQADPVVGWLMAGLRNDSVAKVLRLYANTPPTWNNLYRIFEVVEQDVGGRKYIEQQGWATDKSLERFKRTANSVSAIGDEARHGKESTQPPSNPMTLPEAKSLIETILHN